ncbi:MAG: hypothetical protein AAFV28_03420 [Cyanobacteria bacterium J06635_13]
MLIWVARRRYKFNICVVKRSLAPSLSHCSLCASASELWGVSSRLAYVLGLANRSVHYGALQSDRILSE